MKLIITTIQDQDTDRVVSSLTAQAFRVTRVGSVGGFLLEGNATLLLGVEDAQVEAVLTVLRHDSQRRVKMLPVASGASLSSGALYNFAEVQVGGATVFILEVEQFVQF